MSFDIEELYKEKDLLEVKIKEALNDFQEKTGVCPSMVFIQFIEIFQVGIKRPTYLIGKVSVDIKL